MADKVLLRGGCVLTLGSRTPNFTAADVLIEDGKVAEVGPALRARHAELVDASDTVVMPGFVDCHRHVWRSLLRNLGPQDPGTEAWAAAYRPDDLYAATLVGLLGAAEAGITTVVDWSDLHDDRQYTDAALQAHADAGVRSIFVRAVQGEGQDPAGLARLLSDSSSLPPLTAVASGHDEKESLESAAAEWGRARELGVRIHAHAGVDPSHQGFVSHMAEAGLLTADVTLVHCSHLNRYELAAVASHQAAVALTPSSEMAGGRGTPPMQELIDRGIRPGLGVDDERDAPGDMFAQMRAVISLQHATLFDRKLAGKGGVPQLLSTREVIRYATVEGARVAGLGGVTGSLEPGREADIIVLRTDRPNISPVNDPIGAVVWGMDTSNLDWVFVGGRALMRHGELQGESHRARERAMEARRRVVGAAGLMAQAGPAESA